MMEPQFLALYELAMRQREAAYAPYSGFQVGAILETTEGKIYSGCNVENGSLGLSICAERVAVTSAVADGQRSFSRIVVVASPLAPPCGACRQFLSEFFGDDAMIHSFEAGNPQRNNAWNMKTLLPDQFRFRKQQNPENNR